MADIGRYLVEAHLREGRSVAELAAAHGVHRSWTVHVGASQYHEMVPAAALGYRTVFIDRHREPLASAPTRVMPDLSSLPKIVAELE